MKTMSILAATAALTLSACVEVQPASNKPPSGGLAALPENVQAIVAPGQDLSDVRVNAADNCFVYRYKGPVETTYLPLRNKKGQPICIKKAEPAPEAAA